MRREKASSSPRQWRVKTRSVFKLTMDTYNRRFSFSTKDQKPTSHIPLPPTSHDLHRPSYTSALYTFNRPRGTKSLSGQQGLDLLGRPRHQLLRVFVAVGRAAQRRVDLPVGSAHQLRGLAEDVIPARKAEVEATARRAQISTPGAKSFWVSSAARRRSRP